MVAPLLRQQQLLAVLPAEMVLLEESSLIVLPFLPVPAAVLVQEIPNGQVGKSALLEFLLGDVIQS